MCFAPQHPPYNVRVVCFISFFWISLRAFFSSCFSFCCCFDSPICQIGSGFKPLCAWFSMRMRIRMVTRHNNTNYELQSAMHCLVDYRLIHSMECFLSVCRLELGCRHVQYIFSMSVSAQSLSVCVCVNVNLHLLWFFAANDNSTSDYFRKQRQKNRLVLPSSSKSLSSSSS